MTLPWARTNPPSRISIQWVDGRYFDEAALLKEGYFKLDAAPVCLFEQSAMKVKAPGKTLIAIDDVIQQSTLMKQSMC